MILQEAYISVENNDLSRVCGDDPHPETGAQLLTEFVPRMRG